jgi:hypothetical protein
MNALTALPRRILICGGGTVAEKENNVNVVSVPRVYRFYRKYRAYFICAADGK